MIGGYDKKNIIKKLQELPTELLGEVEDFIDFLKAKNEKKKSNVDQYRSEENINLIKKLKVFTVLLKEQYFTYQMILMNHWMK